MSSLSDRSCGPVPAAPALNAILDRRATQSSPLYNASPRSPHTPNIASLSIPHPRSVALDTSDSASPHSIVSSIGSPPPGFHHVSYSTAPITQASDIKTEDVASYMPYNSSFHSSWPYAQNSEPPIGSGNYFGASFSTDTAHITRTMRSDTGPGLEVDLGCRAPSQQCYIANSGTFNVLDRYVCSQGV